MSRITRQNVESALESFNALLGLPTEYSVDGEKQNGHIFLHRQNGYNNIYQICGPGASSLACGLTMRQAHDWVCTAMQGAQMAQGLDTSR